MGEGGIDTSAVTDVITNLGSSILPVVVAAIGVGATVFGIQYVWKKAKSAIN